MLEVSESVLVTIGNGLESLVGKFGLLLVIVWIICAVLGRPEMGVLRLPVKPKNTPGSRGNWQNGPANSAITQQEWHTAVAMAAGS